MSKIAKLKRVFFRLLVGLTFLLLALGVIMCGQLIVGYSGNTLEAITGLIEFLFYLLPYGLDLLRSPFIAFSVCFWVTLYVGSLVFCAQTVAERRLLWVVFPAALLAVTLTAVAGLAAALSALASQGAGQ